MHVGAREGVRLMDLMKLQTGGWVAFAVLLLIVLAIPILSWGAMGWDMTGSGSCHWDGV